MTRSLSPGKVCTWDLDKERGQIKANALGIELWISKFKVRTARISHSSTGTALARESCRAEAREQVSDADVSMVINNSLLEAVAFCPVTCCALLQSLHERARKTYSILILLPSEDS